MRQAVARSHQVGVLPKLRRCLVGTDDQVAAHAGGEVDHYIDLGVTDAGDHFSVKRHVAAALARYRIAHVAVHNGRACLGRVDRGSGNLFGCDGNIRVLADGVAGTSHRTGDDNLGIHAELSFNGCVARTLTPCEAKKTCRPAGSERALPRHLLKFDSPRLMNITNDKEHGNHRCRGNRRNTRPRARWRRALSGMSS